MRHAETCFESDLVRVIESMQYEITIALTPAQAACVVAGLQLALRHPRNDGAVAVVGRSVCETLIGAFPAEGRALLDQGFRSEFDAPAARERIAVDRFHDGIEV